MEGDCAEASIYRALGGEGAVDEVDFLDGPFGVASVDFVLQGGADEVSLGRGQASSDSSKGEVGGEGAPVGV